MPVIKRRLQPDVRRQEHTVAEHVAGHVADAGDREVVLLDIGAELTKMPFHTLPGAAGGNAHRLVVVAGRAAGGEGIAEPELILGGDPIGDVGEGRRALVGGNDEIGVVGIASDHTRRDDYAPGREVVRDVQQSAA